MRIGTSLTDRLGFIAFSILALVLAVLAVTRLTGGGKESALEVSTQPDASLSAAPTTEPLSLPDPTPTPMPTSTPAPSPTAAPTPSPTPEPKVETTSSDSDANAATAAKATPAATPQPNATAAALPTVVPPNQAKPTAVTQPVNNPAGGQKPATPAATTTAKAPASNTGASNSSEPSSASIQAALAAGSSSAPSGPAPSAPTGPAAGTTAPAAPAAPSGQPVISQGPGSAPAAPANIPPPAPRGGTFTHTLTARPGVQPTLYTSPGGTPFVPTFRGQQLPAVNPTVFGRPLVYRVTAGTPNDGSGWAQVYVPAYPNGTTAWVQTSQFNWGNSNYLVQINVTNRTVTIYNGGQQVLSTSAVVGKSSSPTPIASGWVEEIIPGPNAAYGPRLISLGIYSETLRSFGNSVPKIGLHGTNRPDLMGQSASNGCIRVTNEMITQIASTVPVGSKVEIVR